MNHFFIFLVTHGLHTHVMHFIYVPHENSDTFPSNNVWGKKLTLIHPPFSQCQTIRNMVNIPTWTYNLREIYCAIVQ